tara:strand:- start:1289 stop:3235 length:1947 start_codon:yes stop_codon:yes gene_type:complete
MAKLGDLVVRIGADTRDLNKSLGKVQRNMRSMTSNFTALGQQMTRAITLPILGVGAMAIKSAADLEKMEVSFISLTGGAKQAADMMKQLNEFTANTPFQIEAVANAARQLIATGTDLPEINNTLGFLGDIAASTGNQIDDIAAIFAKVKAKGKVELESLNQLMERGIPIADALRSANSSLGSELGAGAVSVKEFEEALRAMASEGGIANGSMERLSQTASGKFSTALDQLQLAGAALAEDLLPIVNSVLDSVTDLAKKFTTLTDSQKQNILVVSGLLAVIGPLLIGIPKLISGINGVTMSWRLMTAAMMVNPLVVAATAVAALSVVFISLKGDIKGTRKETENFIKDLDNLDAAEARLALKRQIRAKEQELRSANKKLDISKQLQLTGDKFERQAANKSVNRYNDIIKHLTQSIGDLKSELVDLNNAPDIDEAITGDEGGFKKATEDVKIFNSEIDRLLVSLNQAPGGGDTSSLLGFLDEFQVKAVEVTETVQNSFIALGESFGTAFGEMATGAQTGKEALKSFARDAIRSIIAMAKASVIANATSPTNPANILSAGLSSPAFAIAGLSALEALLVNVPALKTGGLAYGPTLAMVGDNAGASVDPEVIAPLSKLEKIMGNKSIQVYGRISGDDIVISNDRASRDRNRF